MTKRHKKSFQNKKYEEQMLLKYWLFLYEVMSKLDENNKILTKLVSMQKSAHTSTSADQNINIKQEIFKSDYENEQYETVEHHINKPEWFRTL